jgi:hypothetical protein
VLLKGKIILFGIVRRKPFKDGLRRIFGEN